MQEMGDMAFDVCLAMTGDSYSAAVAYEATIAELREKETGETRQWLCPACNKEWTLAGQLCVHCEEFDDNSRDWYAMVEDMRHGG